MSTTLSFDGEVISHLELRPDASRASGPVILSWHFSDAARQEMRELREKNSEDLITPEEYAKLDSYRRVTQLLDMMQAKARQALQSEANNP
jgi:hypothetical protein